MSLQEAVEFALGDANLEHDAFLRKKVEEGTDGWVDVSLMLSFARVKALGESASITRDAVLQAAASSAELDADAEKGAVRRKDGRALGELPTAETVDARTVFVDDGGDLDALRARLGAFGALRFLKPLHFPSGKSKECAFVEFEQSEDAVRAAAEDERVWTKAQFVALRDEYHALQDQVRDAVGAAAKRPREESAAGAAGVDGAGTDGGSAGIVARLVPTEAGSTTQAAALAQLGDAVDFVQLPASAEDGHAVFHTAEACRAALGDQRMLVGFRLEPFAGDEAAWLAAAREQRARRQAKRQALMRKMKPGV